MNLMIKRKLNKKKSSIKNKSSIKKQSLIKKKSSNKSTNKKKSSKKTKLSWSNKKPNVHILPNNILRTKSKLSRTNDISEPEENFQFIQKNKFDEITKVLITKSLNFFVDKLIQVHFIVYDPEYKENITKWLWIYAIDKKMIV